ncbi:hypothetical protein MIMGU_mgv1a024145mg [Erythranthe guttata]|uniref:Protein kinase domain-containing protein n=1 Tax=Erythranthe guttata TaxID=4155 RepID=A0A022RNR9_ERYGU|nr:hypothetical protein MIMGU_mgv1a024145mg [Erythranthe guttata]
MAPGSNFAGERDQKTFKLKYEDLAVYTGNFSESNYLSHFQFGKLYRGKIVRDDRTLTVMVKMWEILEKYNFERGDNERRLMDEIMLLRHEMHPGMVKLYGYCNENHNLGAVYEFNPFDSNNFFNLSVDGFTWLQRMKVALGFASLLKFMHAPKCSFYKLYIVRNLDCAHIVVDEDYNPKLCDFGLITGGIFPDRTIYIGYIDVDSFYQSSSSDKQDVFTFGVILLNLVSKRVYSADDTITRKEVDVVDWALKKYKKFLKLLDKTSESERKNIIFSVVDQNIVAESDFEAADEEKISELVIDCVRGKPDERPTMKQVIKSLLKLKSVKKNANFLEVTKRVRTCANPKSA